MHRLKPTADTRPSRINPSECFLIPDPQITKPPQSHPNTIPESRDQDVFKDVLETAAFTPFAPSYRHAKLHGQARNGGPPAVKLAGPLDPSWRWRLERLAFFGNATLPMPSAWLPLRSPPIPSPIGRPAAAAATAAATTSDLSAAAMNNATFGAVPLWLFSSFMVCPHGSMCDGRWAWNPAPVVIGHMVGAKAKFWILRLLGWWHFEAARALSSDLDKGTSEMMLHSGISGHGDGGSVVVADKGNADGVPEGDGQALYTLASGSWPVFPAGNVRPLVLRGHSLSLPPDPTDKRGGSGAQGIHRLQQQMAHWALLGKSVSGKSLCAERREHAPATGHLLGDRLTRLTPSASRHSTTARAHAQVSVLILDVLLPKA